ncbi:MAG: hypothetical protein M5R42_08980 [Rhodocyclaceae bacterium]|nr:hypothetical protein [Rhodocyclaceae bacterium]
MTITEVQVDGATIMNSTLTAGGGTNSSGERSALATALANAINSYHTSGGGTFYMACAGGGCALGGGVTIPADTVAIIPTTTAGGGLPSRTTLTPAS